jgi:hypothetical protein
VSTFQERLAARPNVPHGDECRLCHPPEGRHPGLWLSASVGALTGGVVALFVLLGGV